jgi:hypothetical protein
LKIFIFKRLTPGNLSALSTFHCQLIPCINSVQRLQRAPTLDQIQHDRLRKQSTCKLYKVHKFSLCNYPKDFLLSVQKPHPRKFIWGTDHLLRKRNRGYAILKYNGGIYDRRKYKKQRLFEGVVTLQVQSAEQWPLKSERVITFHEPIGQGALQRQYAGGILYKVIVSTVALSGAAATRLFCITPLHINASYTAL